MTQKLSRETPPIIMVTVNRFFYDRKTQSRRKRLDPVDLSYSITISEEFFDSDSQPKNSETDIEVDMEIDQP